jgi:hypothetical protein
MISTFDGSLAKNIAPPPRKGSQYNLWGRNRADVDKASLFQGLHDCQSRAAVQLPLLYAPEYTVKVKGNRYLPALPIPPWQAVPNSARYHYKRRIPVALPGTSGAHGKPRLLVYQAGTENASPLVHIQLPAHSLLPPENPQTRLIKPFVIVIKNIAPILPVVVL